MKTSSLALKATLACALTATTGASLAADPATTRAKIEMALQGDIRSEAEVARDANRKPGEVLEFFGLEDDMKVLEISPATGYWSKFVGPTLCANGGELVVSVGVSADYRSGPSICFKRLREFFHFLFQFF